VDQFEFRPRRYSSDRKHGDVTPSYAYCTVKLKSNDCVELLAVAVIVTMWLPAGVPVEELPPPLGELPLPPPQAQIANANNGTRRQRRRIEFVEALLK
jgi:hypothetical protein